MNVNEIIKEAEYADIILSLLSKPYYISSVTKITFLAFCIYHETNFTAYNNRTKDFTDVFFENISVKLAMEYTDVETIIRVLDLLSKTKKINIKEDEIKLYKPIKHKNENKFITMCLRKVPDPIIEINKLDPIAIIEEVIRYV